MGVPAGTDYDPTENGGWARIFKTEEDAINEFSISRSSASDGIKPHAAYDNYKIIYVDNVDFQHQDQAYREIMKFNDETGFSVWTNNDCLTNAVAVMKAYGANVPDVQYLDHPNSYFNNLKGERIVTEPVTPGYFTPGYQGPNTQGERVVPVQVYGRANGIEQTLHGVQPNPEPTGASSVTPQPVSKPAQVTLTLTVGGLGDGAESRLSDAKVTVQDAAGNSFMGTTDSNGAVILSGQPGIWQITISKEGYDSSNFNFDVTKAYNAKTQTYNDVLVSLQKSIASNIQGSGNQAVQPSIVPTPYICAGSARLPCGLNAHQQEAIAALDPVTDKEAIAEMKRGFYDDIARQINSNEELRDCVCLDRDYVESCGCDDYSIVSSDNIDCTGITSRSSPWPSLAYCCGQS